MKILTASILTLLFRLGSFSQEVCICPKRFHPVCGSDAITYSNYCNLLCHSSKNKDLRLAHNGSCCPQLICSLDRKPICDNFGRTHHNECFLNRARCLARKMTNNLVSKIHDGECSTHKEEDCSTICDFPSGPVCDHLANTYESLCALEQLNCKRRNARETELLLLSYDVCNTTSELPESEITEEVFVSPEDFEKLAAVNSSELTSMLASGEHFSPNNSEEMETPISSIKLTDITQPCSAANCDKTWNPVCDANNKTHRNLCLFKFHACKMNRLDSSVVDLLHEGECFSRSAPAVCKICTSSEDSIPACDNLNQTHASLCEISRFNCFQRLNQKPERVLIHLGVCTERSPVFTLMEEKCPVKCTEDRKPVCDEAGVTHHNLCSFQRSHCVARQAGHQVPMLKHVNECGPDDQLVELKTEAEIEIEMADTNSTMDISERYKGDATSLKNLDPLANSRQFECPTPTCEEDNSPPVCDSKGRFHKNICMFTYARCVAAQNGVFLTTDQDEKCLASKCNEHCDNITKPLCGSDLSTYQNECFFYKEKCKDSTLDILFYGSCSECLPSPCPVLTSDAPDSAFVCDAEDVTRSLCEYQMLSCIADKHPALNFSIIHLGKCCGSTELCRIKPEELFCGRDGRTYRNRCELDLENCRNEKLLVPTTEVDYKGECIPKEETEEKEGFQFEESSLVQEGEINSTIDECTQECEKLYSPVCGLDDVTYTNLCFLKSSNCKNQKDIEVAYTGECCELKCPSNFDPVCDDEGTTHKNLCYFGRQRCIAERAANRSLTIAKFDVCSNDCMSVCTQEYKPICGANGITYINLCELDRQNCLIKKSIKSGVTITFDYEGECCPSLDCSFNFAPVCDSEGTTHSNECVFQQTQCIQSRHGFVNLTVQYKGACCDQGCDNDYVPVCDGNVTHKNICRFRTAQCETEKKGSTLSLSYSGECCSQPTGSCKTSGIVCDSYGQTHSNLCQFEHKKCLLERTTKKNLTLVHRGECCAIEPCHKVDAPVCDTRGGTHASMCHFQNTQCIHNKIHRHSQIHLAYNGTCCSSDCGNDWEPVCDQHGAIYKNQCWFQRKGCEYSRRSLGLLLETPCTERRIRSLAPRLRN